MKQMAHIQFKDHIVNNQCRLW